MKLFPYICTKHLDFSYMLFLLNYFIGSIILTVVVTKVIRFFVSSDHQLTKEDKEFLRELLDEAEKEEVTEKK